MHLLNRTRKANPMRNLLTHKEYQVALIKLRELWYATPGSIAAERANELQRAIAAWEQENATRPHTALIVAETGKDTPVV